jgi:hypothetical protein
VRARWSSQLYADHLLVIEEFDDRAVENPEFTSEYQIDTRLLLSASAVVARRRRSGAKHRALYPHCHSSAFCGSVIVCSVGRFCLSRAVSHPRHACVLGAICAAIDFAIMLGTVTNNSAAAMGARGCHRVDRTFEAVEGQRPTGLCDLEGLIVVVAAHVAFRHG